MLFDLLLFKGHVIPLYCEMSHPSVPPQCIIGLSETPSKNFSDQIWDHSIRVFETALNYNSWAHI